MLLVKMAFRNVMRNRRRSVITIAAIACGIFTMVTIRGLIDGIGRQSENNLIDLQYGHLEVFNQGFYEDPAAGLSDAMTDPAEVLAALKKIDHVESATPRLTVPAMVSYQGSELPCLAVGIDLARDGSVFRLAPEVRAGQYLKAGPHAMVGERLARTLDLKTGDQVVWKSRALGREGGSIQAVALLIDGVLSTGNPAIDGNVIFIPLDFMRESLLAPGRATQVAVRLDSPARLNEVRSAIQSVVGPLGFEVKTWEDLGKAFLELHRVKKIGNAILIGVFLFIVMVGIVNTMLMATFERTREVGMLMALGLKASEIRKLFLTEGAVLGLIGAAIGAAAAAPLMYLAEVYGIPLQFFTGGADVDLGYPIRGVMYGELSWQLIVTSIVGGALLAMLATVLPAWRASRLDPTEALRHV